MGPLLSPLILTAVSHSSQNESEITAKNFFGWPLCPVSIFHIHTLQVHLGWKKSLDTHVRHSYLTRVDSVTAGLFFGSLRDSTFQRLGCCCPKSLLRAIFLVQSGCHPQKIFGWTCNHCAPIFFGVAEKANNARCGRRVILWWRSSSVNRRRVTAKLWRNQDSPRKRIPPHYVLGPRVR